MAKILGESGRYVSDEAVRQKEQRAPQRAVAATAS